MIGTSFDQAGSVIYTQNGTIGVYTHLTIVFSSIGFFLSTCALLLLILTACLFAEWRRNFKNQLLIQFMLIRFYYNLVRYYTDLKNVYKLDSEEDSYIYLDEFAMVYSETALIAWMFVFTKQMYSSLVTVLNAHQPNPWLVSTLTWIIPIFVTALYYILYRTIVNRNLLFFFIYLLLAKWPVLIANGVLLILILKSVTKQNESKVIKNSNRRLIFVMNIMLWTFCFQQITLDVYKLVTLLFDLTPSFNLPYNILTMYHCAFSIFFWVLGNNKTRELWRERCCGRQSHRPLTINSQLSRSASVTP